MPLIDCPGCNELYDVTETSTPFGQRDKGSLDCEVCGTEYHSWNGACTATGTRVPGGRAAVAAAQAAAAAAAKKAREDYERENTCTVCGLRKDLDPGGMFTCRC